MDRRGSSSSYFCPYTENHKFDQFLTDLFSLKTLDDDRKKSEILRYMQTVETFYTDRIHSLKSVYEKRMRRLKP